MTSAAGAVMLEAKDKTHSECLVMANLSLHPLGEWMKAMQEAGQPWSSPLVTELVQVKALLRSEPDCYVLVCFDSPEQSIANDIRLGRMPSQALANWQNWAEALLEVYRENYHRMTLVSYAGLFYDPQALCEQLTKRSGIALGKVPVAAPEKMPAEPYEQQQLTTNLLIAQLVLTDSAAQLLSNELKISALPILPNEHLIDRLDKLFEEHQSILTSLSKFTVADYEKNAIRVESFEKRKMVGLSEEKKSNKAIEENEIIKECKAKLDDLQKENDMVIQQLHRTQEELEQYMLGNKGSSAQLKKLERNIEVKNEKLHAFSQKNKRLVVKLEKKTQELQSIRQSKSWRLTAPLRRITKLLGGKP